MPADALRPPSPRAHDADAYKDWLHLNLFHHLTGAIGLINVSLHGDPAASGSRAVGTALLHLPDRGWVGQVEVVSIASARIGVHSVALAGVALAVDGRGDGHHGTVLASVRFPDDGLMLDAACAFASRPFDVEQRLPLGPGWISWYVVPRLATSGQATVAGIPLDLASASAYHDHNWGRWKWGQDLGWEWSAFLTPAPGPVFVISRATSRDHRLRGAPLLIVDVGGRRRHFRGASIRHQYLGSWRGPLRRVPGALAALHTDRGAPRLPSAVRVEADDGQDRVSIEFEVRGAAQLIAAEPSTRGYGFIHEMVGGFRYQARLERVEYSGEGLAVVEHAD